MIIRKKTKKPSNSMVLVEVLLDNFWLSINAAPSLNQVKLLEINGTQNERQQNCFLKKSNFFGRITFSFFLRQSIVEVV